MEPQRDDDAPVAPPPAPPAVPERAAVAAGPPRMRRLDVLVLALIVLGYAVALFARLGHPGAVLEDTHEDCRKWPPLSGQACHAMIPLDEVHYVPDARDVLRFGTESDTRVPPDDGAYVVHPPVGKWFIALGIKIFGDRPFGWRAFGAVFAIIGVLVAYALARRLWGSPWWGAFAAVLLAADGLWFVQARVAMLDIYAATLTLAGVWLVIEARDRRTWRAYAAAGVVLGLALATKWGPAPIVFVALLCAARWGGWRASATVALIPIIYVATFTPWFVDDHRYVPPACEGEHIAGRFGAWACYQNEMYHFHRDLEKYDAKEIAEETSVAESGQPASAASADAGTPTDAPTEDQEPKLKPAHPYFGHGWSWPWMGRPVAHHYESSDGKAEEVLGLPNPVTWWTAFFIAIPALLVLAFRRDRIALLLLAFISAAYLPYVAADFVDRPVFLFYATPLVPFLVLAVTHLASRAHAHSPHAGTVATAFVAIALAASAFFYPVLAAYPVPTEGGLGSWRARIWMTEDCNVEDRIKLWCWI